MTIPHKIEKYLLWAIRGGIVLSLFSPLIYTGGVFFPFIIPRAVYFQIIAEILLALTVTLIVFFPAHRPKWTFIGKTMVVFFAAAALSTITSADMSKSFFGTVERAFGFFNIIHFGFLYLAAITVFRTKLQWNILLGISLAIAIYAASTALIPTIKNPSIPPETVAGNQTFLAAYIIFHLFFAAQLFFQVNNKWLKILLTVVGLIFLAAIFSSGVRGAFVGVGCGILFLFIYAIFKLRELRTILLGVLIIGIACYVLVFLNRENPLLQKNFIVGKITNFSLQDSTIQSRFAMWDIAIDGFKERPLLGWGRENYTMVFNKHYDPAFDKAGVGEGWEDRTHNIFFDELIDGGIIGLLAYISFLVAIFWTVRKQPLFLALFIAFVFQNLFGVETLNSFLPLFLCLAYADFFTGVSQRHGELLETSVPTRKLALAYILSGATVVIVVLATTFFTIQPAVVNYNMQKSMQAMVADKRTDFEKYFGEGVKLSNFFPSIKTELLGLVGMTIVQQAELLIKYNMYTIYALKPMDALEKALKGNLWEQRWTMVLVQLTALQCAATLDTAWCDKADGIAGDLLTSSPERKLFQSAITKFKLMREAIEKVKQNSSAKTDPNSVKK